jgi:hypothetical protein
MPVSFGDLDYEPPTPTSMRATPQRVQTRFAARAIRAHSSALLLPPPDFGSGSEPISLLTPPRTIRRYGGNRRRNRERVTGTNTDVEDETVLIQLSLSWVSSIEPPEAQNLSQTSSTSQVADLVMKSPETSKATEEPLVELQTNSSRPRSALPN